MAARRFLGCLAVAALALVGCKDKASTTELDKHCEQLAKACGDTDKHIEKLVGECKQAAKQQVEKGCTAKAQAVYDCYETQLCTKTNTEKVWTLGDLDVLSDRHSKCVAERAANRECAAK